MKKEELLAWWEDIFANHDKIYIYGASFNAKKLFESLEKPQQKKVQGFLVTAAEENPVLWCSRPVWAADVLEDRSAAVLVYHLGVYRKEILDYLEGLHYRNVYAVGDIVSILSSRNGVPEDGYMEQARKEEGQLRQSRRAVEQEDRNICQRIQAILQADSPDFGGVMPYQSMEVIGLEGKRPTLYRILKYGLREILNESQSVLDIGCNSGFLDMMVAPQVKQSLGIEYEASLVEAAQLAADYLGLSKCRFIQGDFNEWCRENSEKAEKKETFDVIFSFAIHHWLHISAEQYTKQLDSLLKPGGFCCFESHILDMSGEDKMYEECLSLLRSHYHFETLREEGISDGDGKRRFALLKKKGIS